MCAEGKETEDEDSQGLQQDRGDGWAVALGLTLSACGNTNSASNTDSKNSGSTPTVSFMLDWTPNTNHIGLYVAQKLGYYKDADVNVKILPTAQAGAETSVENGVANVGFTTLSNVAAFNSQGADLKFVFDLTQKSCPIPAASLPEIPVSTRLACPCWKPV